MLRYSYNNIIITVTNVITLKFLSAQSVHPGALRNFIFFNTSRNIRITKASKHLISFSS